MVSEDDEMTRFQHVVELLHGLVDSQLLPIVSAVFLLCRVELLGEECQWLRGVVDTMLQQGIYGASEGVCDKCKLRGWLRVRQ
jgi:hypothetical protein